MKLQQIVDLPKYYAKQALSVNPENYILFLFDNKSSCLVGRGNYVTFKSGAKVDKIGPGISDKLCAELDKR